MNFSPTDEQLRRRAYVLERLATEHSTRRLFLSGGWHRCRCGALLTDHPSYWRHQAAAYERIEADGQQADQVLAQRAATALALRTALRPLVAVRDEHLDIDAPSPDPVITEAAEALDRAFDAIDSALRSLEDEDA